MQIVDDGAAAEIEEMLAQSPITCASSLPVTNMCEGVLIVHAPAQFGSSFSDA